MDTKQTWWQRVDASLTPPEPMPAVVEVIPADWDGEPTANLKTPTEPMAVVVKERLR